MKNVAHFGGAVEVVVQIARRRQYYLAAAGALAAFLVYLPALPNEFVNWDDDIYVYDNPHIRSLDISFFRWAFLGFPVSNWHPLTWISHALDYAFWGLNPLGHHLTSIILHAVNTGLVVLLAAKLLEAGRERSMRNGAVSFLNDRTVLIAAGVTGLLFGIHPVHVESVAWVSERKDLLCALFFLLSIIMYVKYASGQRSAFSDQLSENNTQSTEDRALNIEHRALSTEHRAQKVFLNRYYLLALGLFVLALMSKPMAVSLPVVLLILDWYPFDRIRSWKTFQSAGVEKLPFFALSLASAVLTVLAQRAGGAMTAMDVVPLSTRTLVAAKALIVYMEKMVLPVDLIPFYPYPKEVSLFSFASLSAIGLIMAITIVSAIIVKNQRVWITAWGYYVLTLVPVLGIIQVGGQAMADRYTYLPSLGPFLIIGIMAAVASEKAGRAKAKQQGSAAVSLAAALFVVVALSSLTIRQITVWRTSLDLWNHVITKEPRKVPLAYYNRGQVFMNGGQLGKAIEDYSMAITLNPSYQEAFYNRGLALEKSGRPDLAAEDYERAIALNPSNYQAFNNRGILYGTAGSYDRAIESFTRALAVKTDYPDAYFNRGITYILTGRRDRAFADLSKAIELNPQFAAAYLNRGKLLLAMDRKGPAVEDFRKACEFGIAEACSALR
jgi:tetratricopeptide (TPR) repeat protein